MGLDFSVPVDFESETLIPRNSNHPQPCPAKSSVNSREPQDGLWVTVGGSQDWRGERLMTVPA